MANALMIDYEFCTGCHACEVACKKHLGLPAGQHGIRVLQDLSLIHILWLWADGLPFGRTGERLACFFAS